ncbi:MAG: DnaB-like helicase C-terminal domain-containing protein [Rhodoglobus sp.]
MNTESTLLRHEACPACPSHDAFAVYDDGHGHCFSCGAHVKDHTSPEVAPAPSVSKNAKFLVTQATDLPSRHITAAVCRSHGYGVANYKGQTVQVADYCNAQGEVVAQKIKTPTKEFHIIGEGKSLALWPMWRWKPGGKRLLITEGETDLLCWQSLGGNRWPAVSLPNGAAGAKNAIAKHIDFVESFDEVVLCFDNDEAGRKAVAAVCEILSPGKARVMRVPEGAKDICEAAQKGLVKELVDAFWGAVPQRPDGIVGGPEILKALLNPPEAGIPYPWKGLNEILMGLRRSELVTLTAGTGVGKSLVAGLIAHHLIKTGHKVGYISLEESLARTAERLVGAEMKRPLHVSRDGVSPQQLATVWQDTFDGRVCVFNHFGSMDAETLMGRIRYMRIAEKVDFVVLDHLSILVSGWGDGDERRLIDNCMTTLRSICEQTGVGMLLISHLSSPPKDRKSHEEGGRPKLNELRGSKAISQISDAVIAVVRDQLGEDPHLSEVWVLKNRFTGRVGKACSLRYDAETGAMEETHASFGAEAY